MRKKPLMLFLVFVGLLATSIVVVKFARPTIKNKNTISGIGVERISKINFITRTGTTTLENQNDNWMLVEPILDEADDGSLEPLLGALQSAQMSTVVSENPAYFSDYGVKDGDGTRLEVFLDKLDTPALDGYVGKIGPGYTDAYFRFNGSNNVYLASQMPPFLFQSGTDSFRLRKLFERDINEATALAVAAGKVSFEIEKSSDVWKDAQSGNVISAVWVDDLRRRIAAIDVASFVFDESTKQGFDAPAALVTLSWNGDKKGVTIGNLVTEPSAGRFTRVDGRELPFLTNVIAVQHLLDLLKKPPVKA